VTTHVDLEALSDLRTPWCLRVAVTLRIAEHIEAATVDLARLAAATRCDADALGGVLRHLVAMGVFEEPSRGRFALNDAARRLLDPGERLGLDLEGIGGRMAHAWATLLAYVRTGAPAYADVFGRPFFEDLDAHPAIGTSFDALMGQIGHGTPDPEFDLADGWSAIRHVVDVGGGTGGMLAELLRLRPGVRGTLVDLPKTAARAAATFRDAGVDDRATTIGQSFFDPLPAGADLYLLRGVINDWPDREAREILQRCCDAARPGGRVVVLKSIGPDEAAPRGVEIEWVLVGGKARNVSQFAALAGDAGLEVVATSRQRSGTFVVECRPSATPPA
jgi:SAM-dependent methyltransferase